MAQKQTQTPAIAKPDSAAARIALEAIRSEVTRYGALRSAAVARSAELFKRKVPEEKPPVGPSLLEVATKIANGHAGTTLAPLASAPPSEGIERWRLDHETIPALDLLISATQSKVVEAYGVVGRAVKAEKRAEWTELTRQIALTLASLQRLVAEREKLRDLLRVSGGDATGLACATFTALGDLNWRDVVVKPFIAAALREGIISKRELERDNA
jgi:hypothetical protein